MKNKTHHRVEKTSLCFMCVFTFKKCDNNSIQFSHGSVRSYVHFSISCFHFTFVACFHIPDGSLFSPNTFFTKYLFHHDDRSGGRANGPGARADGRASGRAAGRAGLRASRRPGGRANKRASDRTGWAGGHKMHFFHKTDGWAGGHKKHFFHKTDGWAGGRAQGRAGERTGGPAGGGPPERSAHITSK